MCGVGQNVKVCLKKAFWYIISLLNKEQATHWLLWETVSNSISEHCLVFTVVPLLLCTKWQNFHLRVALCYWHFKKHPQKHSSEKKTKKYSSVHGIFQFLLSGIDREGEGQGWREGKGSACTPARVSGPGLDPRSGLPTWPERRHVVPRDATRGQTRLPTEGLRGMRPNPEDPWFDPGSRIPKLPLPASPGKTGSWKG